MSLTLCSNFAVPRIRHYRWFGPILIDPRNESQRFTPNHWFWYTLKSSHHFNSSKIICTFLSLLNSSEDYIPWICVHGSFLLEHGEIYIQIEKWCTPSDRLSSMMRWLKYTAFTKRVKYYRHSYIASTCLSLILWNCSSQFLYQFSRFGLNFSVWTL